MTRDTRPVDPEDRDLRDKLGGLARALRQLHSALLEAVRGDFERQRGPVGGPFVLFRLVTGDPFFAWLRPLSLQMALIDELIDEKRKLAPADAAGVRATVEALFVPDAASPEAFAANYVSRLQSTPSVAVLHAQWREALDRLPRPDGGTGGP